MGPVNVIYSKFMIFTGKSKLPLSKLYSRGFVAIDHGTSPNKLRSGQPYTSTDLVE